MLPMTQALAEYVALAASSLGATMGAGMRQAVRFGSDHFVAVIAVMIAFVMVVMVLSGSRR